MSKKSNYSKNKFDLFKFFNRSKNVEPGQILLTKDDFFWNGKNTDRTSRMAVVTSSNENDELGLVKLYTNGIKCKDERFKSYKPYLYITDNNGNPIKINKQFKKSRKDLMTEESIRDIFDYTFKNKKIHQNYQKKNSYLFYQMINRYKKRSFNKSPCRKNK